MRTISTALYIVGIGLLLEAAAALAGNAQAADRRPGQREDGLTPLNEAQTVLLDVKGGRVLMKTKVVLQAGVLEMLCCKTQTKEHESILAFDGEARIVHAGLLAIKAKPGQPVQYLPDFTPPRGQQIDIFLQWRDQQGKLRREPAQRWIRHAIQRYYVATLQKLPNDLQIPEDIFLRYDEKHAELIWFGPMSDEQRDRLLALSEDKQYGAAIRTFHTESQSRQMQANWVFAGSEIYVDEPTGEKLYMAENGDLICVANFPSAMIDLAIASTASEQNLLFEAWTERIPPKGTEVTVELIPAKDGENSRRQQQ